MDASGNSTAKFSRTIDISALVIKQKLVLLSGDAGPLRELDFGALYYGMHVHSIKSHRITLSGNDRTPWRLILR